MEPPLRYTGPFFAKLDYSYKYNDTNGEGLLYLEGKKIANVLVRRITHDSQLEAERVKHVNLLRCITVDRDRRNLIYEWPEKSVEKYITDWCNEKASPRGSIMRYSIPTRPRNNVQSTHYLAPLVREVIRQLCSFINYQHTDGKCVTEFTLGDLWMCGNLLKISNVGVYESVNQNTRKENFEWVDNVIKALVDPATRTFKYPYPPALKHLREQIKELDYSNVNQEKLLVNHLAILPPSQVVTFITECGKQLIDFKEDSNRDVLTQLPFLKKKNWVEDFFGKEEFYYVQLCFEHRDSSGEDMKYVLTGTQEVINSNLLRFARNLAVHVADKAETVLDPVEIETIVMHLFHEHLLAAEIALFPTRLPKFIQMI